MWVLGFQQLYSCFDGDEIGQQLDYLIRKLDADFEILRDLMNKKLVEEIEDTKRVITKILIKLFEARPNKISDQINNFVNVLETVLLANKLPENINSDDKFLYDCAMEFKLALKAIKDRKTVPPTLPHLSTFTWLVMLDAWETWIKLRNFMRQDLYGIVDADFNKAFHLGGQDFFAMLSAQLSLVHQEKFSSKRAKYILARYIVNLAVFPFPEILGNSDNFIWQIQSYESIDSKILPLIAQAFGVTIQVTQGTKKISYEASNPRGTVYFAQGSTAYEAGCPPTVSSVKPLGLQEETKEGDEDSQIPSYHSRVTLITPKIRTERKIGLTKEEAVVPKPSAQEEIKTIIQRADDLVNQGKISQAIPNYEKAFNMSQQQIFYINLFVHLKLAEALLESQNFTKAAHAYVAFIQRFETLKQDQLILPYYLNFESCLLKNKEYIVKKEAAVAYFCKAKTLLLLNLNKRALFCMIKALRIVVEIPKSKMKQDLIAEEIFDTTFALIREARNKSFVWYQENTVNLYHSAEFLHFCLNWKFLDWTTYSCKNSQSSSELAGDKSVQAKMPSSGDYSGTFFAKGNSTSLAIKPKGESVIAKKDPQQKILEKLHKKLKLVKKSDPLFMNAQDDIKLHLKIAQLYLELMNFEDAAKIYLLIIDKIDSFKANAKSVFYQEELGAIFLGPHQMVDTKSAVNAYLIRIKVMQKLNLFELALQSIAQIYKIACHLKDEKLIIEKIFPAYLEAMIHIQHNGTRETVSSVDRQDHLSALHLMLDNIIQNNPKTQLEVNPLDMTVQGTPSMSLSM